MCLPRNRLLQLMIPSKAVTESIQKCCKSWPAVSLLRGYQQPATIHHNALSSHPSRHLIISKEQGHVRDILGLPHTSYGMYSSRCLIKVITCLMTDEPCCCMKIGAYCGWVNGVDSHTLRWIQCIVRRDWHPSFWKDTFNTQSWKAFYESQSSHQHGSTNCLVLLWTLMWTGNL